MVAFLAYFLHVNRRETPRAVDDLLIVILGIVSLLFRQTNVFWVSVFPAAVVLVTKLQDLDGV